MFWLAPFTHLAIFGIDDAVLAIAFVALSAASAGMSYYSSRQQAAATEDIANANKKRSDRDAEQLRADREAEASAERKDARRRRARIESMYAASGVLLNGTSAEDALAEQAATDELNVLNRNRVAESQAVKMEENGRLGIWEASLRAQAIKTQGNADVFSQGVGMLSGASKMGLFK